MPTVGVVDDDEDSRLAVASTLEPQGWRTVPFSTAKSAVVAARDRSLPPLVTMDMSLASHVKAGRINQQMAFERCHDPEELQRLIGSTGGLSDYSDGGSYGDSSDFSSDFGQSPGGGWASSGGM